jgi:outer membrane protein assembly factor BamD
MILIPIIVSCSTTQEDKTQNWNADKLYVEAKSELDVGNYEKALSLYQKLESRYPFGAYAQQAQIETAYTHWQNGDSASAIASLNRYKKLYPNQTGIAYALYLEGLINFNDKKTLFSNITGEDMAERDALAGKAAFQSFKKLVTLYPKSKYTPDAVKRMRFLINVLAENEIHVARFYLRREAFVASLNRCKTVLERFQETPAVEEALAIMTIAYSKLNLLELSNNSLRVLVKNFPDSPYISYQYNPKIKGGLPSSIRKQTETTWMESGIIDKIKDLFSEKFF